MSGARGARPGPDGHHDDLLPEDLEGLTLQAPDDASELDADRDRWLQDARALPPASPLRPLSDRRTARRRRLTITASVVLISMAGVAVSGAVGAWIVGPHAAQPAAAPLASVAPDPGQIGGLLPEATLEKADAPASSRSLRPAVLALVPPDCPECPALLSSIAPSVGSFGVSLVAVGGPDQSAQLADLREAVGTARLSAVSDPGEVLRGAYGLTGVTLLLVRDDGVVVDVVRHPTTDVHLESALVELVPAIGLDT